MSRGRAAPLVAAALLCAACAVPRGEPPAKPERPETAAAHADPAAPRRSANFTKLVGTWLGERPEGDRTRRWLITRRSDGSFEVRFHDYAGDELAEEQEEYGSWGADDGRYATRTTQTANADGIVTPPQPWVDVYRIVELTDSVFTYEHVTRGTRYTVRRVADDYDLR